MEIAILVLGAVSLFFIYKIYKAQSADSVETQVDTHKKVTYSKEELRLENVQKGGMIQLRGIGADMEDFDVSILSRHIYREGESTWYELEGDRGDSKVWLEFEEDDELEIAMKVQDIKLRNLGLARADLDRMDDKEDGQFEYEGEKYFYEDSGEAVFYRHGVEDNSEKFYYWNFENDKEDKFISVESWDGELEASISVPIKNSQVTVYSLKA